MLYFNWDVGKERCANMLEKNKHGFTLIEMVVVLIILGVLAKIALPSIFANVHRQRAQEALRVMAQISDALETCYANNNDSFYSNNTMHCSAVDKWQDWNKIKIDNPSHSTGTNPGAKFDYFYYIYMFPDNKLGYFIIARDYDNASINLRRWRDGQGKVYCDTTPDKIYDGVC